MSDPLVDACSCCTCGAIDVSTAKAGDTLHPGSKSVSQRLQRYVFFNDEKQCAGVSPAEVCRQTRRSSTGQKSPFRRLQTVHTVVSFVVYRPPGDNCTGRTCTSQISSSNHRHQIDWQMIREDVRDFLACKAADRCLQGQMQLKYAPVHRCCGEASSACCASHLQDAASVAPAVACIVKLLIEASTSQAQI